MRKIDDIDSGTDGGIDGGTGGGTGGPIKTIVRKNKWPLFAVGVIVLVVIAVVLA